MKDNYIHKSKYFYGNEISEYGLKHGYIDYKALAKCGDKVLCNDITKLFYNTIGNDYMEPEQVNGYIDNSEEIEELQEQIEELQEQIANIEYNTLQFDQNENEHLTKLVATLQEQIDQKQDQINELQEEQDNPGEIFQYFIISDNLAQILQDLTNEIIYYLPALDIYIWGITHWGTSWDYVLTDIKIDLEGV